MMKFAHPFAGALAIATIGTFWVSTVLSELFASHSAVAAVKAAILWGFVLLIPALAVGAGSGVLLAKGRRVGKFTRLPFIAGNGLLVLVPSALLLASKPQEAEFDATFYAVQALELVSGATNITLLALNMRDGLKMRGWVRGKPA